MLDKASILKEAQKQLAKGALDKAIAELEKLVKESPDGNTYNMIGDIYLRKGSQKAGIDYYQRAANFFRQEGFSQKALALYKKVLNINSADTDALYAFGELSEEKGLITDAIKYYLAVADLLAKEGRKEKLLDIYNKILSLSPGNVPLRIKVAEIFYKEGLKSDAAAEYVHIASIYDEKEDFQKAREFFQRAIEMQPLNKAATLGLNVLYEKTGEIRQAMIQMKEAAVLFPDDIDILFRCSEVSLLADDTGFAKECLRKITEKEPKNLISRRLLAEIYLKAGAVEKSWQQYLPVLDEQLLDQKFEDAIAFLSTYRAVDPLETGRRLVSLYRQLGENDRVVAELISLGDVYAAAGQDDDAKSCYTEAGELDPMNSELRKRLEPPQPEAVATPEAAIPESLRTEMIHEFELPDLGELEEVARAAVTEPEEPVTAPGAPAEEYAPSAVEPGQVSIRGEKSYDEIITEADIFSRYGLLSEAQRLLEGLKQRFPENIDVHLRLKSVYSDTHDKESAVTECIILSELYKRRGDTAGSEQALKEACEISPEDPRLADQGFKDLIEQTTYAAPQAAGFGEAVTPKEPDIEDYEEEIAEADFYSRQGLTTEAIKILERLHNLFPENSDVNERLAALGQTVSGIETGAMPEGMELPETFELPEPEKEPGVMEIPTDFGLAEGFEPEQAPEQTGDFELPENEEMFGAFEKTREAGEGIGETGIQEQAEKEVLPPEEPAAAEPPKETEYEEFSLSDHDLVDAQEMPEPALDSDVLEIFQEFKKGLEKELGDEDSETHYNLGIAYKEMGLVDDAIKEFQSSRNDPKSYIQSSSMLGVCYMEKGLYGLAVDVFSKALNEMKEKDEAHMAMKYDLAEAHEKNNNLKYAIELYTEVYGWNAKFRNVSDKMEQLRAAAPGKADAEKEHAKEKPKERKDRVSYL